MNFSYELHYYYSVIWINVLSLSLVMSGYIKELAGNCAGIIVQKPRRQSMNCGESGHGFVCETGLDHVSL